MKTIKFLTITTAISFLLFSSFTLLKQQQKDYSQAKVSASNGKLIFYENEPVNGYDVAFTFEDTTGLKNAARMSFDEQSGKMVTNANKEVAVQGKPYDAIIHSDGSIRDRAITFKDKTKDNSIASVNKNQGKYVFLYCEPVNEYDMVFKMNAGGLFGAMMTLQQKVDRMMKKAGKKNIQYDGVIFSNSSQDMCIKFK